MRANDVELLTTCREMIFRNPNLRNERVFLATNPGGDYLRSLADCFEKSDFFYAFAKDDFAGVFGLQRTGIAHGGIWLATTANVERHARFLVRSTRKAAEWLAGAVGDGFIVGGASVNKAFEPWSRFLAKLGGAAADAGPFTAITFYFGGL